MLHAICSLQTPKQEFPRLGASPLPGLDVFDTYGGTDMANATLLPPEACAVQPVEQRSVNNVCTPSAMKHNPFFDLSSTGNDAAPTMTESSLICLVTLGACNTRSMATPSFRSCLRSLRCSNSYRWSGNPLSICSARSRRWSGNRRWSGSSAGYLLGESLTKRQAC